MTRLFELPLILLAALGLVPFVSCLASSKTEKLATRRQAFAGTAATFVCPAILTDAFASPAIAVDLSSYQDGPRGLKYQVTLEGDGPQPVRAQKVSTSYSLFLKGFPEDGGEKIDSSKGFLGDKPFDFIVGVGQVIKGWDLAILDMKVGEARRLVIPSDLGYGEKGAGGKIPGGSTLYFEVELTGVGKEPELKPEQLKWLEEHPM